MKNANSVVLSGVTFPVIVPRKNAAAPANVMASIVDTATTVAKGKPENYSAEVTVNLLAAWAESEKTKEDVTKLATLFGKTARSIVAKLSREKVYVKATYVTKTGEKPVSKEQHVIEIATLLGIDPAKLESLEKANKNVLTILQDALNGSAELFDAISETVAE